MLTARQTDTLIHVAATTMFAVLLLVAILLLYYTTVAMAGDPGGVLIDRVTWVLERQKGALGVAGTAVTAVPALALGLANTPGGKTTRRGWIYVWILLPTWLIATVASFLLEPQGIHLGTEATPTLADSAALAISGFALTFLAAILGLKRIVGAPTEPAKPKAPAGPRPPATPPPPSAPGDGT